MNDEVSVLRDRLREHVRSWLALAGTDFLGTLSQLYLADPANAFQASEQDHLVITLHKQAMRELITDLNAKTELAPVWRDIIRELIADDARRANATLSKATIQPTVPSSPHRSRPHASRRTITRLQATLAMFVVLASVAIFTWFLVRRGWHIAPEAEVEIHYNYTVDVGGIIGWTLAGIGVASAGVAYAIKLASEIKKPEKETED